MKIEPGVATALSQPQSAMTERGFARLNTGATINGRVLAHGAAVTLASNTIVKP